jgi:hypothetical protein
LLIASMASDQHFGTLGLHLPTMYGQPLRTDELAQGMNGNLTRLLTDNRHL